jgi:hypothetical protein
MSRTLSTKSQTEVVKQTTRPVWLVEFGFGTPLRLSSRETIAVSGGNTFTAAGIKVNLASKSVQLFNEGFQYSATFLAGVAGVSAKVWKVYGAGPFALADLDQFFDGEIGPVPEIGPMITIGLRPLSPVFTPRIMIAPPTFNHLPPDGFQFVTPTGVYILNREP